MITKEETGERMLPFTDIHLKHRETMQSFVAAAGGRQMEQSFAGLYIWSHKFKVQLCQYKDFLLCLASKPCPPYYLMPIGQGDPASVLPAMEEDAHAKGNPFVLRGLTASMRQRIETALPKRYQFTPNRASADYLYLAKDLQELSGRKYHSKRNFIARFEETYHNRWSYEPITKDNLKDVWAFQDMWCRKNDCASNVSLQEESTSIALLLYNMDALRATGGLLYADGRVAAFTVGSLIGKDTMDIHVEKADYETVGAYPMINREYARRGCAGVTYINREEDMGLEGLRRAKLSYGPVEVCEKFTAVLRRN